MTSDTRGIVVVHPSERFEGKQGVEYVTGISAESAGTQAICAHVITIPPGGRARAHLHEAHESVVYMLEGSVVTWFGHDLADYAVNGPGDLVYIPAGVPHLPVNMSTTERAVALITRTDPNEQESVVLLPELDDLPHLGIPPSEV
jgi:uncharacterized RmlC-like cupin family protein